MKSFNRILAAVSFVAVSFALATPGSAIGAEVKARWEVNYGNTECRLIRHFGATDQSFRLEVGKSWSFGGYDVRVIGGDMPVYSSATTITFAFGAPLISQRFETNPYMIIDKNERAVGWNDPGGLFISGLRQARYFRLTGPKKLDVALDLPNGSNAIKELETCEDDLLARWGFDASEQRSLTTPVKPSNYPGRWVTSDDYPRVDLAGGNEGIATFLLNIDAEGSKTGCQIVESSGFPTLDSRTCELLLKRATFYPAMDKAGKAVPSFYVNRILWQLPR